MSLTSFIWKHRAQGPSELPTFDLLESAAYFPGFTAADVDRVERLVVELDLNTPSAWAAQIPRRAENLRDLFAGKGFHLVGVARAEVTDQLRPVWVALLKKGPVLKATT